VPDLNEFLTSKEVVQETNPTFEKLNGIRPCGKCEEDVDGGLWDPNTLTMSWTCSRGHENSFKVN
jgi:hypothetical protein